MTVHKTVINKIVKRIIYSERTAWFCYRAVLFFESRYLNYQGKKIIDV